MQFPDIKVQELYSAHCVEIMNIESVSCIFHVELKVWTFMLNVCPIIRENL